VSDHPDMCGRSCGSSDGVASDRRAGRWSATKKPSQHWKRGRDAHLAISVIDGRPLSNTVGTVLDPIFSLRRQVRIPARATARVAFWTMVAPTRAEALDLADKHHDSTAFERAVTLAWTQAQVQLHHLRVGADEAHLFQRLANRVLYSDPTLRPSPDVLKRGEGGPSKLWGSGISGDLPIVLVRIDEVEDLDIVRQLGRFTGSSQQPGFALVLEPEALAVDVDDDRGRARALLVEDSCNQNRDRDRGGKQPHREPSAIGVAKVNSRAPAYIGWRTRAYGPVETMRCPVSTVTVEAANVF
jgi:hypothetical protein